MIESALEPDLIRGLAATFAWWARDGPPGRCPDSTPNAGGIPVPTRTQGEVMATDHDAPLRTRPEERTRNRSTNCRPGAVMPAPG